MVEAIQLRRHQVTQLLRTPTPVGDSLGHVRTNLVLISFAADYLDQSVEEKLRTLHINENAKAEGNCQPLVSTIFSFRQIVDHTFYPRWIIGSAELWCRGQTCPAEVQSGSGKPQYPKASQRKAEPTRKSEAKGSRSGEAFCRSGRSEDFKRH